ncbi:hypothetical protein [Rhodoblastus sp.]|uniref:hypothetical protein n=1 Tax=Rhodoblastus sp. TaxID=1962975 RepID=UPI00261390F4|nr:hypothetical protein [Rhodoblastus sp.]
MRIFPTVLLTLLLAPATTFAESSCPIDNNTRPALANIYALHALYLHQLEQADMAGASRALSQLIAYTRERGAYFIGHGLNCPPAALIGTALRLNDGRAMWQTLLESSKEFPAVEADQPSAPSTPSRNQEPMHCITTRVGPDSATDCF